MNTDKAANCRCTANFCEHHSSGGPCPGTASDPTPMAVITESGTIGPESDFGFCKECWHIHKKNNAESFRD